MEVKEILESLGYIVRDEGNGFLRARPIYRESDNDSSLRINSTTGYFVDWGISTQGSLGQLIKMTLGLKDIKEAYEHLESNFKFKPNLIKEKPKIKISPKFSEDFVSSLKKDSYWLGRGISQETIDQFEGGIDKKGSRYWFVIRNEKREIIGLTGRTLINSKIKWIIKGAKKEFNYNLLLNYQFIKEKNEVILLESIGDYLSLFESGIKNCLVCFGLEISNSLLSTLIKLDLKRIIIAFNSDKEENNYAGENGAKKAHSRLSRYFDQRQLQIKHPDKANDFNEQLVKFGPESIRNWYSLV